MRAELGKVLINEPVERRSLGAIDAAKLDLLRTGSHWVLESRR